MKPLPNYKPKEYWAYIYYSSKERKWGEWLHRRLEKIEGLLDEKERP